jgi:outer membrane protein assembly factor BamB
MVVAADGTGSVLWAGSLNRALTLDEVSLTPLPGGSDAFVVKLDGGTGRASWGQRVGVASVSEGISRLKADGAGNLVMVLNSRVFFETPSNQLAKLDAGGALLWSWSIAQTHYQDLDLDAAGNALLSGNFSGTLDFGGGPRFSPSRARFLAWYDANGGYLMDTYFPGTDSSGTAVDIDAEGHVLLGGSFQGTVDFGTGPVSTSCREEMFVLELDPTP